MLTLFRLELEPHMIDESIDWSIVSVAIDSTHRVKYVRAAAVGPPFYCKPWSAISL